MRRLLFDNPAPLFFAIFCLAMLVLRPGEWAGTRRLSSVCRVCGYVSAAACMMLLVYNVGRVGMLWHDEANILSIACAFTKGQPMYHAIDAPMLYSLFYGPSTFLVYAPFLTWFNAPILPIRIVLLAAVGGELWLLYVAMRTWISTSMALGILPVAVALLLAYPDVLMGTRGDLWMLLCMTIALTSMLRSDSLGGAKSAAPIGFFAGAAVGFKATIAPAACLVLLLVYKRYGMRATRLATIAYLVGALGMFALPHISLLHYFGWLHLSSHQRFLKSTCLENMVASSLVLAPIVLIHVFGEPVVKPLRTGRLILCWGGLSLLVCILSGSKDGAGGWHLWPVIPFFLAGAAYEIGLRCVKSEVMHSSTADQRIIAEGRSSRTLVVVTSMALAGMFVSMYFAQRDFMAIRPSVESAWRIRNDSAQKDLRATLAHYSGARNLSMGYGKHVTDYRTDLRYELPLARQDYFFDENGVVEGVKAGFPLPENVLKRILGCRDLWLIPHGEIPFSSIREGGVLPITTTPYIFPDALRLHFADSHELSEAGATYDVWKCRKDVQASYEEESKP